MFKFYKPLIVLLILGWPMFKAEAVKPIQHLQGNCRSVKGLFTASLSQPGHLSMRKNSCLVFAKGSGEQFETVKHPYLNTMVEALTKALNEAGWKHNDSLNTYAADAPYSSQFALEKNGNIAIIHASVTAKKADTCPKDQPLDLYNGCKLKPVDRHYDFRINIICSKMKNK